MPSNDVQVTRRHAGRGFAAASGLRAETARQPVAGAATSSTRSSGGSSQDECAAASTEPSGDAATLGTQPVFSDAGPSHSTWADPSSASLPAAAPVPRCAANHSDPSPSHSRQVTSSSGASTRAGSPCAATVVSPARIARSEQKPSTTATVRPSGARRTRSSW